MAEQVALGVPADDGVDGTVERRAEDHGGHRRKQTAGAIGEAVPGRMQLGGETRAGRAFGVRQDMAVGSGVVVVPGPGEVTGSGTGRRAVHERLVGVVRAAGVQVPACSVQPAGHPGHVGQGVPGRFPPTDSGINGARRCGGLRHRRFLRG